jgi:iron complex outermembrane receptor protein
MRKTVQQQNAQQTAGALKGLTSVATVSVILSAVAGPALLASKSAHAGEEDPMSADELANLSIEELANMEVISVTKQPEPAGQAAAALYVITANDIRRSGATSLPEILRLAPNLQVARIDARTYSITARGFGMANPNKLLVMIDGRSVYSPLHAAVFWDAQEVLPENIERVEVISGPGGTTWGANAVNGVINIITRDAAASATLVRGGLGTYERNVAVQQSGSLSDEAAYRVYAQGFERLRTFNANSQTKRDNWDGVQGGFRFDWNHEAHTSTVQGDIYRNRIELGNSRLAGENILGRWQYALAGDNSIQVQAYYDRAHREVPGSIGDENRTYDIEAHQALQWDDHKFIWGAGYRAADGTFTNVPNFFVRPASEHLDWANVFAQDTFSLSDNLKLTAGLKYEHSSYSGGEFLPSIRVTWLPQSQLTVWAAASRAVRTPSRTDRGLFQLSGTIPVLVGSNFQSETLNAYELGLRVEPSSSFSLSLAGYYNVYDDLRSVELSPRFTLPASFGNMMEGETYGLEGWANYTVTDTWRLSAGFSVIEKDLRFKPGSRDVVSGLKAAGNDPGHHFFLRSSLDVTNAIELDMTLRGVGELPDPRVSDYAALDARLGWRVTDEFEVWIKGENLLDRRHAEYGALPGRSELARTVYLGARWRP